LAKLSGNTSKNGAANDINTKNTGESEQGAQGNSQNTSADGNTTGRGSGSVPNENVYISDAKNYNDYNAELEGKSSTGSGNNQKAYVDGETGEIVPYNEVFGEYKKEAIAAVEKDGVPYGIRDIVMDYFSSLE
jgi:hypothetical protein